MKIRFDGSKMTDREALHDLLQEALCFPQWYGRNLDALYDLLTSYPQELRFEICDAQTMLLQLGSYGTALLETLQDAAGENPKLTVAVTFEKNENFS